jgi:hypothetical protein
MSTSVDTSLNTFNFIRKHFLQICVRKVALYLQKLLEVISTSVDTGLNQIYVPLPKCTANFRTHCIRLYKEHSFQCPCYVLSLLLVCNLSLFPNALLQTLFSDTLRLNFAISHTFKIVAYIEIGIRILTDLTYVSVFQVSHCISVVPQVHAVCIISMVMQQIITRKCWCYSRYLWVTLF